MKPCPAFLRLLTALLCAALLSLTGCQTPDLKPFAAATTSVAASIGEGGDLAVSALAEESFQINGEIVAPGSDGHPAKQLATAWEARAKAADALLVYSSSLAALNDASANRKENAAAVYGSLEKLASAIPGVSLGSSAVGNLLITATSGVVEVKAWHSMREAVEGADPAVQLLATAFKADLRNLGEAYAGYYNGALIEAGTTDIRALRRLEAKLRDAQAAKRNEVNSNPLDQAAGSELTRIDALLAPVAEELANHRAELARIQLKIAEGRRFYAKAAAAVDAWAAAHHDLRDSFAQNRAPNLALLTVRAQELQSCLAAFKDAPPAAPTP